MNNGYRYALSARNRMYIKNRHFRCAEMFDFFNSAEDSFFVEIYTSKMINDFTDGGCVSFCGLNERNCFEILNEYITN
jgi:hypothetical protein